MLRRFSILLGALAVTVGCAAGGEDVTSTGPTGSGGSAAVTTGSGGAATGGAGGAATSGSGGSGGQGGALSGTVDLCVLNEGEPYGPCEQPPELDFGVVSSGTAETRTFRIDNGTPFDVLFKSASVANANFTVQSVRFEEDPGSPGSYLRVVDDVPVVRPSGKSLWFEVKYTAVGAAGPLPTIDTIVRMNVDNAAAPDVNVPIVGEESGCATGLGACDADPTNGCETDTNSSNTHCGSCNNACDPLNGGGQCVGGVCTLTSCDNYFGDCDMDPVTGCEVSFLNDPMHCGSCANNCSKSNTVAICAAANCNVMGCLNNYGDCNLMASDGCETNLANTIQHCGGCNLSCALPNAAETCVPSMQTGLGVCTLGACDAGYKNCDVNPANGCEINSTNDVQNCGGCFNVCNFANAASSCATSMCQMGACNNGYANCDNNALTGCEVNLTNDKDHCGNCMTDCDVVFPGSQVSCSANQCQFNGCSTNYWNNDNNSTNGCEYFCVQQVGQDLPDDAFVDKDCDGIDGDADAAVFVATDGNDTNPGTPTQPMLTVGAGLGKAQSTGKTQVYVSNGTYAERVTLINGISIYGGYSKSAGWARSSAYVSRVRPSAVSGGRMSALEGFTISSPTTVDRMTIETLSTSSPNVSNYGVYCNGCTALTLKNNTISSGNAGPGSTGGVGSVGADGGVGGDGFTGSCDGSGWGAGGPIGSSPCGRTGGKGGRGGTEGANAGIKGDDGIVGITGGGPGSGGDPGGKGTDGDDGTNGGSGNSGAAGSGGVLSAGFWLSTVGGSGGLGGHGNGGGGGGGGGGQGCLICNNGSGNGGGGGGGAGCGGSGAAGGTGGGGSFGIFLLNSTGITLTANTVQSGNGGTGGSGGAGGGGGTGLDGGLGATYCTGEVGAGGNGGKGGNGGFGGGGGGGAGGPSYGVYRSGTTVSLVGNSLNAGSGGSGGSGGFPNGNAGIIGASADNN